MKKKTLLVTAALLFLLTSGCGSPTEDTSGTPSTTPASNVPTQETGSEYDEEYWISQIADYPVEILGIRKPGYVVEFKDVYTLYMTAPEILEISDTCVTAEGILQDATDATVDIIGAKYYINDEAIVGIEPLVEADKAYTLTPAVPFSSDLLYEIFPTVSVFVEDAPTWNDWTIVDFTKEAYPSIELDPEGWRDNYDYEGTLIITSADGTRYISTKVIFGYSMWKKSDTFFYWGCSAASGLALEKE